MEYDELMEKIKDALKITRELELYEKADLRAILKEAWRTDTKRGSRKAKKTEKEISIIELKRLTNELRRDIIGL